MLKRFLTPFLGLLLAGALCPSASQAESRASTLLREYARQHNFPVREIETGPSFRRVKRLFVPVTQQSFLSWCSTFSAPNSAIHLCWDGGSHIATSVNPPGADGKPADCYLWARNYNGKDQSDSRGSYMIWNPEGGRMFGAELGPEATRYLIGEFEKVRTTATLINPLDGKNLCQQGCMAWQSHIEVAKGVPLFHLLGCKRTKGDGYQCNYKLSRVANDRVVIGICVNDPQAFIQMTDDQLLGPLPKAGMDEAAHQ